jgi:hypothetical protein
LRHPAIFLRRRGIALETHGALLIRVALPIRVGLQIPGESRTRAA